MLDGLTRQRELKHCNDVLFMQDFSHETQKRNDGCMKLWHHSSAWNLPVKSMYTCCVNSHYKQIIQNERRAIQIYQMTLFKITALHIVSALHSKCWHFGAWLTYFCLHQCVDLMCLCLFSPGISDNLVNTQTYDFMSNASTRSAMSDRPPYVYSSGIVKGKLH